MAKNVSGKGGGSGSVNLPMSMGKTGHGDYLHPLSGDKARGLPRRQKVGERTKPRPR